MPHPSPVFPGRPALFVMGVSGCGKSSIAAALAAARNGIYVEADALHPAENVAHMAAGQPLSDAMRLPWLRALALHVADQQAAHPDQQVFTACSALKRSYRDLIRTQLPDAVFLHLSGNQAVIAARMAARQNHFMPTSLLDSQFATLETPQADEAHVTVSIDGDLEQVTAACLAALT
ncbi:Thermoresistant gluconokinase [Thalassovita autumnalis]|uniref:Gluconokinase n=1 Tax=Thalassovita autumnalis TaxID=2072972 RepID=A0A0P1FX59_9RHOB|nr:gluconokinase [Thalassovita autumnalis]CUH69202.1 Thermoresistant gluconokinase [Thalassovita autumnalis]CUH73595.1 Thermoresistant gluconokinase [Thalassovita autumnalis]